MESAVLLCVPEAEALVGAWRQEHDPSAAKGVPARVTLLYPFLPADEVDEGVLGELEWFFAGVDAFALEFDSVGEFASEGRWCSSRPPPGSRPTSPVRWRGAGPSARRTTASTSARCRT